MKPPKIISLYLLSFQNEEKLKISAALLDETSFTSELFYFFQGQYLNMISRIV